MAGACVTRTTTSGTYVPGAGLGFCDRGEQCQNDSESYECRHTETGADCLSADGTNVYHDCTGWPNASVYTVTKTSTFYDGRVCCFCSGGSPNLLTCSHTIYQDCNYSTVPPIENKFYSGCGGGETDAVGYLRCVSGIVGCNSARCCCQSGCHLSPGLDCSWLTENGELGCTADRVNYWQGSPNAVFYDCPPCQFPNSSSYSCSETLCGSTGCCLCDRCCDMATTTCAAKGGTVMAGSCSSSTVRTNCKNANIKPRCKGGIWKLGMRPAAHGSKPGVMSIVSERTHKTKDLPTGQAECRKVYGWLQRSATEGVMQGRICNQYNQRRGTNCGLPALNSKKSPIMKLVRHPTSGVLQWEGKYRTPCPEQPDFLSTCSTLVGCAA